MLILRSISFVLFLALALGMLGWQVITLGELWGIGGELEALNLGGIILSGVMLLLSLGEYALARFAPRFTHRVLWIGTAPLRILAQGLTRLLMGKGARVDKAWASTQVLLAILLINVVMPMLLVTSGLFLSHHAFAALVFQFFFFVDLFLGRALVNYFNSGASAFVSLRYLRKRPVSLASVIGVSVGIAVLIVVNSIMNGFVRDYRMLVRGSLSDVLLYARADAFRAEHGELETEVWRYYVEKIKQDEVLNQQWEHVKALTLQGYRDGRAIELGESEELPTGLRPQTEGSEEARMLEMMDAPRDASLMVARRWLPSHPSFRVLTPENLWLSLYQSTSERNRVAAETRSRLHAALFYPKLKAGMRFLDSAARTHLGADGQPDVIATSPRLMNFAPVSGGNSDDGFEEITTVTAVDPERENAISSIGDYVADAEFSGFVSDYARWPLLNILDACLLFEDPESAPQDPGLRAVGLDDGKLQINYPGAVRLLRRREVVSVDGKVAWSRMHGIRYRSGSPGSDLLDVVERALKRVNTVSKLDALKELLDDAHRELEDLAKKYGASTDGIPSSLHGGGIDDVALLSSVASRYVSGVGEIRAHVGALVVEGFLDQLRTRIHGLEFKPAGLDALFSKIDAASQSFMQQRVATLRNVSDANVLLEEYVEELKGIVAPYVAKHQDDLRLNADSVLAKFKELENPRLFEIDEELRPRQASIGRVLQEWERIAGRMQARQKAYRQVLPLRTHMQSFESVDEYLVRARSILPLLPHELRDDEAYLDRAVEAARERLTACFLALHVEPSDIPAELKTELRTAIDGGLDSIGGDSVQDVQESLYRVVGDLRELVSDMATEHASELLEILRTYEYWRVAVETPGLIVGETLAARLRKGVGDGVRLWVVRRSRDSDGSLNAGRTAEESFRILGRYRSGIFEDNLRSMYGDFESWAALMGADSATYLLGVKLKDYRAYEGRPNVLIDQFERAILGHARDLRKSPDAEPMLAAAADDLTSPFSNTWASVWEKEKEKLLQAVEREKNILTLLLTLIVVLAGVVILIVVYLTVVEKVKDIGILKALGASPWGVRSVFMFNALFIGLFGTVLGAALGIMISNNLNGIEDWVDSTFGIRLFPPDVYYVTYIPSLKGEALYMLALNIAIPTVLWAFFCGIVPATMAARKSTVEALHYE